MQTLADSTRVARHLADLAGWVRTLKVPDDRLALVGIRSRGDVIARRIADELKVSRVGTLDITLYRDDLTELSAQPVVRTTEIDFAVDGLDIVLIDDVLMTGRSIRAAISSLMDLGRPRRVWLAVLVDRGNALRELPIAPDHAAMKHEGEGRVQARLTPTDDRDAIELEEAR